MLIWRGFGFLVPLIAVVLSVVMSSLTNGVMGKGYYESHSLPASISCVLVAVSLWFLGRFFDKKYPERVLIDQQTNQTVRFRKKNDFFYIKIMHWSYVALAFGVITLFIHK